jgi:hypothetical protein
LRRKMALMKTIGRTRHNEFQSSRTVRGLERACYADAIEGKQKRTRVRIRL